MADGIKISELTESATIDDAQFFVVSDGIATTKVAYSTIKDDLIDYSEELAEVISPTVTPTAIEGGHRLTVVDINGTTTFDVMNGAQGPQGIQGPQGDTGPAGYPTDEQVTTAVHNELVAHPEWTTTVQDGSITTVKLADGAATNVKLADDAKQLRNLLPMSELTAGFLYTSGNIANDAYDNSYVSKFINATAGLKYTADVWATPTGNTNDTARVWVAICFYDSNKTLIGSRVAELSPWYGTHVSLTLEAPAGAAFIRISGRLFNDGVMALKQSSASTVFSPSVEDANIFKNIDSKTTISHNLLSMSDLEHGYLYIDGHVQPPSYITNEYTSNYIPVTEDGEYTFSVSATATKTGMWMAAFFYDSSMAIVGSRIVKQSTTLGFQVLTMPLTVPAGAAYVRVSARMFEDGVMLLQEGMAAKYNISRHDLWSLQYLSETLNAPINMNSVAHRGGLYTPENTLVSIRDTKERGFSHVEVDVRFTSDGVPVLLHDQSINRTARNADGTQLSSTVNINSITYEQALAYDFGIYKGADFAGTKIATFEQALKLCRNIGLGIYADLKSDGWTTEQIIGLVALARKCGMAGKVSWIDSVVATLTTVHGYANNERVGILYDSTVTDSVITEAQSLQGGVGGVFIDSNTYDQTTIDKCVAANIPLEVWVIDSLATISGMDAYVTGITSDYYVAAQVIHQASA